MDLDREETLVDWSADDTSLVYDLYANNELLFSTDDTNFYYEFTDPGLYYLYATLSVEDCSYRILQELVVYDVMYALFIDHDLTEKDINVQQTLANDNIGLIPLMIYGDIDSQKPDWAKTFIDRDSLLELSDVSGMFASPDNYSSFFDALSQADATGSALDSIPLMLLSDVDKVIVRKWLAPFVKERNDQPLYLLNKQDFEQVLFDLAANK